MKAPVTDKVFENALSIIEQFACFFAVVLVIKDLRIDPAEFPGMEEGGPVKYIDNVRKIDPLFDVLTDPFRDRNIGLGPVDLVVLLLRLFERRQRWNLCRRRCRVPSVLAHGAP